MSRHELREQIFKLLFRVEFNTPEEMPYQMKYFFEDDEKVFAEKDENYITEKFQKIQEKLPEIDKILSENSEKWDIERIGKVELTILRLATYEVMFDEDIPNGVAIDEAVEIAKVFGQESSGAFVNAILAKIVK